MKGAVPVRSVTCSLTLEHPPTYTLGRRTRPGDLPHDRDYYRERGTAVCDTPRGGQVTWHGPGQLVIYPIIDLKGIGEQPEGSGRVDVAGFVEKVEEAMIEATSGFLPGTAAPEKIDGLTGIWLGDAKVGSIGLRISRGITSHGISLNVSCDLEPFNSVTACGIDGGRADFDPRGDRRRALGARGRRSGRVRPRRAARSPSEPG